MSRFLPAVAAGRALRRLGIPNAALEKELPLMVAKGLLRLYHFQHDDGGWGWWKVDPTDTGMTAYVVLGLAMARDAGYTVDPGVIGKGVEALKGLRSTPDALYALKLTGEKIQGALEQAKPKGDEDTAWLVLAGRKDLAGSIFAELPKSAGVGAIRTASLVLRALASVDPKDPRIPPLLGWLLRQRQGSAWFSTLDTAHAVLALTDLTADRKEPAIRVLLGGAEVLGACGRVVLGPERLQPGANIVEAIAGAEGPEVFLSSALRFHLRPEGPLPAQGPLKVARTIERIVITEDGSRAWEPLVSGATVKVSELLQVTVAVTADGEASRLAIECPIPAGTEAYDGEDQHHWTESDGLRQILDDRVTLAVPIQEPGQLLVFRLRPTMPGTWHILPAKAWGMYEPALRGSSEEFILKIVDR